jgi:hypothetical protein
MTHIPYRYDQFVFRRVRFGGRRPRKNNLCHTSVPDLGGFGDSFARISFHPAARNETLPEAASLQTGLQGHCLVEQLHGGSCSRANSCRANSCCSADSTMPPCHPPPTQCHNHHTPPSSCLHPHAQHCCTPMLSTLLHPHGDLRPPVAARAPWPQPPPPWPAARLSARAALPGAGLSSRPQLAARVEEVQNEAPAWSASLARSRSARPTANAASEAQPRQRRARARPG